MTSLHLSPRSFENSLKIAEPCRSSRPPLSPHGLPRAPKSSNGTSIRSHRLDSPSLTLTPSPIFSAEFQPSLHGDLLHPRSHLERRGSAPSPPRSPILRTSKEPSRSPFLVRFGRSLKAEIRSCFGRSSDDDQDGSHRKPRRWQDPEEFVKIESVHWTEL